jgi:hypothetical protein
MTATSRHSHADLVAYLTDAEAAGPQQFETGLYFQGSEEFVGQQIEFINLDIIHSRVGEEPLDQFGRVTFQAAPPLAPWQSQHAFGTLPGFESQLVLDSYAVPEAVPFPVVDTNPFHVGTFRVDYAGLGLQPGQTITLNVSGRDDASGSRTTSVAVAEAAGEPVRLIDPLFSSPRGTDTSVYSVPTAIPEPSAATWLALIAWINIFLRRKRPAVR